jgi:hypothetical protein
MQKIFVLVVGLIFSAISAKASMAMPLEKTLPKIVDHVTSCSILPYSIGVDGQQTNHALISRCPTVKIINPGQAEIKVNGEMFLANLEESPDSDGDLYEVTFHNVVTGEKHTFSDVPAFGDILLGVLGGDSSHVLAKQVVDGTNLASDANLLR